MSNTTRTTSGIPRTPIGFLRYVSRPHRRWLFSAFIAVTLAQLISTSIPYTVRSIIDAAESIVGGIGTLDDVWFWVVVYIVANVFVSVFFRGSGFLGMQWLTRANATAYQTLFSYISLHSHSYFSNRFAGSLSSKVSNASEGAQSLSEALLWNYYPTALSLIFTIGYIATSSFLAAGLFLTLMVVLIPLNVYLAKRRRPYVVKYSAQGTRVRGYAVDAMSNITAVRQFAKREDEIRDFGKELQSLRFMNIRQWRMSEWTLIINNIIIYLFEILVLIVVVRLWAAGSISIGELVMVITLMISVEGSLTFIGSSINGFIRRFGEIEEGLMDVLEPHEIIDTAGAVDLISDAGVVAFDAVSFDYDEQAIFSGLSLQILSGQKVGLVGPSGAGKTTLVSLLLRQHDIHGGTILIDDQNIAEVTQNSLRRSIAVVPQEPLLFHRTIKENIAYGKPDATDEEVIEAAKIAQAHKFIMELSQGYETLVGERGVKLSGGQRQRVAIARAMIKDAPILVLDEATSSLDSESEVLIQKALQKLMKDKTVVAIAHRLSTLRKMDRIIVLEGGKIVEDGTHEELVSQNGTYARLWEHQAGGFLQE